MLHHKLGPKVVGQLGDLDCFALNNIFNLILRTIIVIFDANCYFMISGTKHRPVINVCGANNESSIIHYHHFRVDIDHLVSWNP